MIPGGRGHSPTPLSRYGQGDQQRPGQQEEKPGQGGQQGGGRVASKIPDSVAKAADSAEPIEWGAPAQGRGFQVYLRPQISGRFGDSEKSTLPSIPA